MNNDRQEHGDFRKKAGGFVAGLRGFVAGLLMGGLAGAGAMLLLVGGWILRGRLAPPVEK